MLDSQASSSNKPERNTTEPAGSYNTSVLAWTARYTVPLCVVIILGLLNLPSPLGGDQALFLIGAKALDEGAAIYIDFWDLKQPGIFIFYWLAGRLFGFSEVGIHLLELIWMCGLTVALVRLLKDYFHSNWLASLVPLTTVGIYYLGAAEWHFTQVEILIALPMILCIWIGFAEFRSPRMEATAFFLLGLCVACIAIFKLILLPLPGMALAISIGFMVFRGQRSIAEIIFRQLVPAAVGLAVGLSCVIAWLWAQGALAMFFWTTFSYPIEAMSQVPKKDISHLIWSSMWFAHLFFPWIPLIAIAIYDFVKHRQDLLTAQFLGWLVLGAVLLLIQSLSWHSYHYLLFFVPTGILALRGADIMYARFTEGAGRIARPSLAMWLILLLPPFGTSLTPGVEKLKAVAKATLRTEGNWVKDYQGRRSERYRTAIDETRHLLERAAPRGPIYVFGDPIYYVLAERGQAIAMNGWGLENRLESHWAIQPSELSRAQPVYVFVDSYYDELIRQRSPETIELMNRSYKVVRESSAGTWYRLTEVPTPDVKNEKL